MNKQNKRNSPAGSGRVTDIQLKNITKCLILILVSLSLPLFLYGYTMLKFNYAIVGINMVFISCVLYAYLNIRRRIVYLIFNICMWVFLISRPTISMLRGDEWWYFSEESVRFSILSLYISLFSILLGAALCERLLSARGMYKNEHTKLFLPKGQSSSDYNLIFLIVSGVAFAVCFVCKMAIGVEKVAYMSGREYYEYYVSYKSSFPYFFETIASMMTYVLCVFLASMPKKAYAYVVLGLYVISTVPNLLVGIRNDVVLALIFSFLYFYIRDYFDGTKKWVGKFERAACVIMIPLALVFLGAYNYIRDSVDSQMSPLSLIVDLFYKQGVSFDVLCIGYSVMPDLPSVVPKNYTFGTIIDYLKTNVVSRALFSTEPFPSGNSEMKAIYGNEFAHSMSYVARDDYLDGHGYGSSFILETYADFGFLGVIIFSVLVGVFLIYVLHLLKKSRMSRVIILTVLTQFFFLPRSSATGCFAFLLYMQFWLPVGAIIAVVYLFSIKRIIISHRK